MPEKKYSPSEIAYLEDVSVSTVYRWIAEGFLKAKKNPGKKGAISILETAYNDFKSLCGTDYFKQEEK